MITIGSPKELVFKFVNTRDTSVILATSHILSVLIDVEYRNCCRTWDEYLLLAIWMEQIQSKLIYLWTGQFLSYKSEI